MPSYHARERARPHRRLRHSLRRVLHTGSVPVLVGGCLTRSDSWHCALVEIVWVPSSDPRVAFRCREGHILCLVVRLTVGLVSRWHCGGWVVRMSLLREIRDPSVAFRCREGHILCLVVRLTFGLVSRWLCGGWVVRMSLLLEIAGGLWVVELLC